ncbi:hypothetical protein [Aeromonas veronii]|uniref:hypothetical protein n=1 Tax=Aeromonas veronii TaxID=654 RepID=UPI002B4716B6|nr:hypothetical protein [Aeromonas veronii]
MLATFLPENTAKRSVRMEVRKIVPTIPNRYSPVAARLAEVESIFFLIPMCPFLPELVQIALP